jgi:hypothetical protein
VYSAYLGGSKNDYVAELAVDSNHTIYIAGSTYSNDFPMVNPHQGIFGGIDSLASNGFVSRVTPYPSPQAYSRYVYTIDGGTLYNQGCELGTNVQNLPGPQDNIVILAFGRPRLSNGQYGAQLTDDGMFVTLAEIENAAEQFARGYFNCTGAADTASRLTVGVGTSNNGDQVTGAHGAEWAKMVGRIRTWLQNNPSGSVPKYSSQVTVVGASDMELGWNSPGITRAWIDGYKNAGVSPTPLLYDFGDAEGCPPVGSPGDPSQNQACNENPDTGWTVDDVRYKSWGAVITRPLPIMYATSGINAEQWKQIALRSYVGHNNDKIRFAGVMTQYQACQTNGPCPGSDNTPDQGWQQLWHQLNDANDLRLTQNPPWVTDVRWR